MATHSSILAWRIPWTEKPAGLQIIGSQRVGQELACMHTRKGHSSPHVTLQGQTFVEQLLPCV